MGTEKRERQKANRSAKIEAERLAAAKAKRNQTIKTAVIAGVIIVVVMLVFGALSGCSSSTGSDSAGSGADDATTTTEFTGNGTAPDQAVATYGTGECPPVDGVDEPVLTFDDAPKQCIDPSKTYTATFDTSLGTVVVELDTERTPVTTNNFVVLARYGYYDGTDIHRVVSAAGFVQGGSPATNDATDPGPGYTIPDEGGPYTADDYTPGILAMARTSAPNSAGGQFFFLAHEGGTEALASYGTYAVFGHTTEGLDVLEKMAALDDGTEHPTEEIVVNSVTITES